MVIAAAVIAMAAALAAAIANRAGKSSEQ